MDLQLWEKTIVTWINSMSNSIPISSAKQINESVISDVIKKIKVDFLSSPVEFFRDAFPNLADSLVLTSRNHYLYAATLLLIYVSFSKSAELEELREIMCTKLNNATQVNIAEFLISIQSQGDVFNLSLNKIEQEIFSFAEKHGSQPLMMDDCSKTPVKNNNTPNSFDSPLQEFFQTPKRNHGGRNLKCSAMCGDGDYVKLVKKLTNQLVEEELEKSSLQEKLITLTQKCNDYEMKLRNKIEEIKSLKYEWENESTKHENEVKILKNNVIQKSEDEKRLKNELSHLENYISTLESDLSLSNSKIEKYEYQLEAALEKCVAFESQVRQANDLNVELQKEINSKERELNNLKENYINFYKNEKSIDESLMEGSFDTSVHPPENMEVVIDKLLRESKAENSSLKETIAEIQKDKNNLLNEIELIKKQLTLKDSTISELHVLTKELSAKTENFDVIEKELFKTQKDLFTLNTDIQNLMKENFQLTEKCNLLNNSLQDLEQALVECKTSKVLLYINFLKLAKDCKSVQQQLEFEVKNISWLTSNTEQKLLKYEKDLEPQKLNESKESLEKCNEALLTEHLNQIENFYQGLQTKELPNTLNCLSVVFDNKFDKVTELLNYFESNHQEWFESKTLMQKTCNQLNDNIIVLKAKIGELKNQQSKSLEEKIELEKHIKKAEDTITQIQFLHSNQIQNLKDEFEEKEKKIKELESTILQCKNQHKNLDLEKKILKADASQLMKEKELNFALENCDFIGSQTRILLTPQQQELHDSLEEIPVCNKTFDIVNLEEKDLNDRTFSVKKKDIGTATTENKSNSAGSTLPFSKVLSKESVQNNEKGHPKGDSWVVPVEPSSKKKSKLLGSGDDLNRKTDLVNVENSNLMSSLSSVLEINYSPPSKTQSGSSTVSCFTFLDLNGFKDDENYEFNFKETKNELTNTYACEEHIQSLQHNRGTKKIDVMLGDIFERELRNNRNKVILEKDILELRKEILEFSKECERLNFALLESENKNKKYREAYEKNLSIIRQNITAKYEGQLEYLKNEMKQLYNRELAKHKAEQSKLNFELREQNKRYKEHIDELRNQLWDLGEKLLNEQKLKRDLERNYTELKKKFEKMIFLRETDSFQKTSERIKIFCEKDTLGDENVRMAALRQLQNPTFPTIPTEDEEEVFDNRFLEDMKTGLCNVERPEGRLIELQYRNSLCLPHLKSSYPAETQFHNPALFKESDLKFGLLQFGQESQSLTDSDHSMTKSLLPENKGKKKEQTSYKRPGPPTPSKNGGRFSIQQSGDLRLTRRNPLKELNDQSERNKGTPNPLKALFSTKNVKRESLGGKDENTTPVTPRKKHKIFRKPFGARDH